MNNLIFTTPYFIFGKGRENEAGKIRKTFWRNKVLLHFGGSSAIKADCWIGKNSLKEEDISFVELGGVMPNPRVVLVYKG